MAEQERTRKRTSEPENTIPDKLYFRIGEVARLCDVPAYVLRFWETEFPQLKPNKGGTGQRLYRRRDVELAMRIKRLLYEEGYTIPGARQVFKAEGKQQNGQPELPFKLGAAKSSSAKDVNLQRVRKELKEILHMLSTPVPVEGTQKVSRPKRAPIRHLEADLF
ncbi:MAG: MerR family transcriptional regulator [Acidobacteriaceae bacterium]